MQVRRLTAQRAGQCGGAAQRGIAVELPELLGQRVQTFLYGHVESPFTR
jgi:hypothetical protein